MGRGIRIPLSKAVPHFTSPKIAAIWGTIGSTPSYVVNFAPGSTKISSLFSAPLNFSQFRYPLVRDLRRPQGQSSSDISGGVFDDNPIYTSEEAEAALIVPSSLNLSVASRGDVDSDARRELAA